MTEPLHISPAADHVRGAPMLPPVPPPATLAELLADAGAIGERFRLRAAPHAGADQIPADAISDDHLQRLVAARGRGLGTEEPRVAATLFLQAYAYRISAPGLAAWVLSGMLPDLSAGNLLLRFDAEGRPVEVALCAPRVFAAVGQHLPDAALRATPDLAAAAVDTLLDRHLLPLHDRLRALYRLGPLLAKGALASQIGMAFTFIDANSAVPWPQVAAPAVAFFEASRDRIEGEGRTGDMIVKRLGARVGTTWRRRTCCLVYRAPARDYCGGCPIRKDPDRIETWATRLRNRSPGHAGIDVDR